MSTTSTTKSHPLSSPIQLRLSPVMTLALRQAAEGRGCNVTEEIRHRLEQFDRVDVQIQGLRGELALHGVGGPRTEDRILDALQRVLGMQAEMLGAMRRYRPSDTEKARADVERLRLPVLGRRNEDEG